MRIAALFPALWASSIATASAAEELLRNPGFEEGAEKTFEGWSPVWPQYLPEPPLFSRVTREPQAGKCSAEVRVHSPGGYCSLTQVVERPPPLARSVRLEAWVRAEKGTRANLLLIFFDPEDERQQKLLSTPRAADDGRWVKVEVEALVPARAKRWMVRCGIDGPGTAAFDEVSLTWSGEERRDAVEAHLVAGRGNYQIVPRAGGGQCSITFSIPFPFGGQTPLSLRVESDPPESVVRLEVRKDGQNRPLRATVKSPPGRKGAIKLRAETVVLLRDRPIPEVGGVPLLPGEKIPAEARAYLRAAPGIELDAALVQEAARQLPRADMKSLLGGLLELLKKRLRYEGGGNQGAKHCLETGQAVCTGYANVCAAVLLSAGVPARILACLQTDGRLQEHYLVEAWASAAGWVRIESTMAAFPWADSSNLILRIVDPQSARSPANVPLFFKLEGASGGGFDGNPQDGCWQSAETLQQVLLDRKDLEAIEGFARKKFEELTVKPAQGARVILIPEPGKLGLGERGRKLLERLARDP